MKRTVGISAYMELTKPRILALVLVTTTWGFYLGGRGFHSIPLLFVLLVGTMFVCGGSSVLNHYLEREFDSKMMRTRNRPIPSGKIKDSSALNFGIVLVLAGLCILYAGVNILTAFLSLLTAFLYIMVYTPMKRVSWFSTTVGAIPGAIPPLGGWAAATGTLNFDAGILFLILFLWQHPHFYAIIWMLRDDYKRAGFPVLPVVEPGGKRTFTHILWAALLLIPVSLVPAITGLSGRIYFAGTLAAGIILFMISRTFAKSKSLSDARRLLRATIFYLPTLLALIVVDGNF